MTMGGDEVDYSSFEYQTMASFLQLDGSPQTGGDSSGAASAVQSFEVLGGVGGLDNNEVAELVALEVQAVMEHEDGAADQNVATSTEFRGNVGINLPESEGAFVDPNSDRTAVGTGSIVRVDDIEEGSVTLKGVTDTDDRRLQHFKVVGGPPFDDETNGVGGNNFSTDFYALKNYRQLTGRGPILDSNDEVSIALNVAMEDAILGVNGSVKVHCIWDIAETDDAGRAFGLPK